MGLDLWFREDVARILASTRETMLATMSGAQVLDSDHAEAYKQGFADAILAMAVAFGVAVPRAIGNDERRAGGIQFIEAAPPRDRDQRRNL